MGNIKRVKKLFTFFFINLKKKISKLMLLGDPLTFPNYKLQLN